MLLSFWIKTFFFPERVDRTSDCRLRIVWAEEFYWEGQLSVDSISVCNLFWFVMLMKPYIVSRKCLLTEGAATFPCDTHHKSWLVALFICLHQTAASNPGAHRLQCMLRDTSPWWHGAPLTHISSWMMVPLVRLPKQLQKEQSLSQVFWTQMSSSRL